MSAQRAKVLDVFKRIHKARKEAFEGDTKMLTKFRERINEEFKKNKAEADPEKLTQLMRTAEDVEATIRTLLVQIEHNPDTNVGRVKIRKSTHRIKFNPFDPNATPPPRQPGATCQSNTQSGSDNPDSSKPDS